MHHRPFAAAIALFLALPAAAEPTGPAATLYNALGLGPLLEIMRVEGEGYGADLEANLFPDRGRDAWAATVAAIYDIGRMEGAVLVGLEAALGPEEMAEIADFFEGETGSHIIALEISARRALLDPDVELAAQEGWMALEAEGGRRWELLTEFAEVNDLVEWNVAGAMTANYAFYRGLADGRAPGFDLPEAQILSDIWSQEQSIREETFDWVYSFTGLAYQPLSEEEFQAYIDFAASPEGQALNAALFETFNAMFTAISRELGLGAAKMLSAQDI